MIIRLRPNLTSLLFATRGSVVLKTAPRALAMAIFAAAVAWLAMLWPAAFARLSSAPFTLFGIALSIFLSFRNNACYDRWWEARKAWGQIMIEVRSLARQTQDLDKAVRRPILRGMIGFAHGLAAQLRGGDAGEAVSRWLERPVSHEAAPCDAALADVGGILLTLHASGVVDGWRYQVLESRLTALSGAQAACERIKTTPVPFAYSLLLHRTAYLFCLMLPFGLVGAFGFGAPLIVAVISYTFFGLDLLGDELEEPFGLEPNDLPLDALVRTVEREMLLALGEAARPPLAPVRFLLT